MNAQDKYTADKALNTILAQRYRNGMRDVVNHCAYGEPSMHIKGVGTMTSDLLDAFILRAADRIPNGVLNRIALSYLEAILDAATDLVAEEREVAVAQAIEFIRGSGDE